MTTTLTEARERVADRLKRIDGLNVWAAAPGSVTAPAAMVDPAPGTFLTFDSTMDRDSDDIDLSVRLLVGKMDDASAQANLDAYLAGAGSKSVKQWGEAPLDEDDQFYIVVTDARDYGQYEHGGVMYLGCEFTVLVR